MMKNYKFTIFATPFPTVRASANYLPFALYRNWLGIECVLSKKKLKMHDYGIMETGTNRGGSHKQCSSLKIKKIKPGPPTIN